MAAQEDSGSSSSHHYAIDIEPGPNCAVCMEPLEWVAVAPCGHREVCAACAARIRFFGNDRRCCICRAPCPTVFVTRASRAGQRAFLWPPPPAFGGEGRVLKFYWYHRGMASYFEDLCQYQEMSKVCVEPPSSADEGQGVAVDVGGASSLSSQPSAASVIVNQLQVAPPQEAAADDDPEQCSCVATFFLCLAIVLALFTMSAVLFVAAEHRYQRVLVVLAFVASSLQHSQFG